MITEFSKIVCVDELSLTGSEHASGRLSDLRQLYWTVLKRNGFTIMEIARLAGKHHGTIIYGLRRIEGLLKSGDKRLTDLNELTKNITR
jgi:predicted transcriptional regulator